MLTLRVGVPEPPPRLWLIVLVMNLVGAFIFAGLAIWSDALDQAVKDQLIKYGSAYTEGDFGSQFSSAVATGFLLALIAWLVEGCDTATGRIAVIWSLAFLVGLGSFDHCIAATVTVFTALCRRRAEHRRDDRVVHPRPRRQHRGRRRHRGRDQLRPGARRGLVSRGSCPAGAGSRGRARPASPVGQTPRTSSCSAAPLCSPPVL